MPTFADVRQFFGGQIFGTVPKTAQSFAGKTVVVTGANTGLGFECAKQLVSLNVSTLILACRDTKKGNWAKDRIVNAGTPKTAVHVWQVDMADYDSVKAFSKRLDSELPALHALVANAGKETKAFQLAEGLESTLTTNVVGTYLLALLTLPLLERTAKQTNSPTHLTVTGSMIHIFADHTQLTQPAQGKILASLSDQKTADMAGRYPLSKLLVHLCNQEMATKTRRDASGQPLVILNCPNPGWCRTELSREGQGLVERVLIQVIGRSAEEGGWTLTDAAVARPDTHGKYTSECVIKPPSAWVRSREGQETQVKLWNELVERLEAMSPGVTQCLV